MFRQTLCFLCAISLSDLQPQRKRSGRQNFKTLKTLQSGSAEVPAIPASPGRWWLNQSYPARFPGGDAFAGSQAVYFLCNWGTMHCWRRAGWPALCGHGGCFRSSFPGFYDQCTFQCQQHFEACCSTAALLKPLQSLPQVPSHPDLLQRSRQSSPPRQPTVAVL